MFFFVFFTHHYLSIGLTLQPQPRGPRSHLEFFASANLYRMPEIAELHNASHHVNRFSSGKVFVRVFIPAAAKNVKDDVRQRLERLESTWTNGFTLVTRSRGKELCAVLGEHSNRRSSAEEASTSGSPHHHDIDTGSCATCEIARSVIMHKVTDVEANLRVRKACGTDHIYQTISNVGESEQLASDRLVLAFFFGMRAGFRYLDSSGQFVSSSYEPLGESNIFSLGPNGLPRGTKLAFICEDGSTLCFIGASVRVGGWSASRSPDPLLEYDAFVRNLKSEVIHHKKYSRARKSPVSICELLLNQSLFNGIGNYMRAEILYKCKIAPFCDGLSLIDAITEEHLVSNGLLQAIFEICAMAVYQKVVRGMEGKKPLAWRKCFHKKDALREVDNLGRTIWYFGNRGPLPGPLIVNERLGGKPHLSGRRLFFATSIEKTEVLETLKKFGDIEKFTMNHRRRYGFVRFSKEEEACEALKALDGDKFHCQFQRKILVVKNMISEESEEEETSSGQDDDILQSDEELSKLSSDLEDIEWEDASPKVQSEFKTVEDTLIGGAENCNQKDVICGAAAMTNVDRQRGSNTDDVQQKKKHIKRLMKGGRIKLSDLDSGLDLYQHLNAQDSERKRRRKFMKSS